jgi:hypothetical protein
MLPANLTSGSNGILRGHVVCGPNFSNLRRNPMRLYFMLSMSGVWKTHSINGKRQMNSHKKSFRVSMPGSVLGKK